MFMMYTFCRSELIYTKCLYTKCTPHFDKLLYSFCIQNLYKQGFIQAILMSVRQHKTLNLLIQFSNSIFTNLHKFYFQACWHWTCIQNELIDKVSSILSYLFVLQIQKGQKIFQGLYCLNPKQDSTMNSLWSLHHLRTPTCILHRLKTQSLFKKWTSVKLLG